MCALSRTPLGQRLAYRFPSTYTPPPIPGQVPLEKAKTSKKLEEAATTLAEAEAMLLAALEVARMMPEDYGRLESAPVLQSNMMPKDSGRPGRVVRMMPEGYKKPGLFSSLFSSKK